MTKALRLLAVVHTALFVATTPASSQAPTAAMAKTCREKALKEFPTSKAGAAHGNAAAQRDLFESCISQMMREQKQRSPPAQ